MATDLERSWEFIRSFEKDFNAPEDRHALEMRLLSMRLMPNTEAYCMGAIDRYERFMLPKKHKIPKPVGWPVCYTVSGDVKREEKNSSIIGRCFDRMWRYLFSLN
jgi:hypothetical protein